MSIFHEMNLQTPQKGTISTKPRILMESLQTRVLPGHFLQVRNSLGYRLPENMSPKCDFIFFFCLCGESFYHLTRPKLNTQKLISRAFSNLNDSMVPKQEKPKMKFACVARNWSPYVVLSDFIQLLFVFFFPIKSFFQPLLCSGVTFLGLPQLACSIFSCCKATLTILSGRFFPTSF